MKGFLSVLALPAVILPVFASPLAPTSVIRKDTAIMQNLYKEAVPIDATIDKQLASISGSTASAATVSELEASYKQLFAQVTAAKQQLEAANGSGLLSTRQSSNPEEELEQALEAAITEIGQQIEKGFASGTALPSALNDLLVQGLGQLSALGGPISSAIPDAIEQISSILTQILGNVPGLPSLPTV